MAFTVGLRYRTVLWRGLGVGSTRNDGMPEPEPGTYRLLVAAAWLAVPFVEVFGCAAASGARHTPAERASWSPSWPACCLITAAGALAFYAALIAARRHGGRALVAASRRRWQSELRAEAAREQRRVAYFGDRRLAFPVVVTPMLWTLPVMFAGAQDQPPDPATGQPGVSVGNIVAGMVLAIVPLLLWSLTGRWLTALGAAAWLSWAAWTMRGDPTAGAYDGSVATAVVLVCLIATIVVRRSAIRRT